MTFPFIQSVTHVTLFARRFLNNPTAVGSLFPSSQTLAEKIIHYIPENPNPDSPRRYLEIGPGTGSFTDEIIKRLGRNDTLDLVELDSAFCDVLKQKYAHVSNVRVFCLSILDWHPDYRYDTVISGLPLNLFTPKDVTRIHESIRSLCNNNGTLSYFEYVAVPYLMLLNPLDKNRKHFRKIIEIKKDFFKAFGEQSEKVYFNFPPARVLHFRFAESQVYEPFRTISSLSNAC